MELGCECQFLYGRDAAEGHVRALVVVCPQPAIGGFLHVLNAVEQPLVEPAITHGRVSTLNVGILLGPSGLDVINPDTAPFHPGQKQATDVFGPAVAANRLRSELFPRGSYV